MKMLLQDLFIYRLDDTTRGLQGTIERYCQLLAAEDPHLHKELQTQVSRPTGQRAFGRNVC